MAKKFYKKSVLFVGKEGTYGVDSTPEATPTKAVLVQNLSITPIEGEELTRELFDGKLGSRPSVLSGKYMMLEFDVDCAAAGAAGTAPAYAELLMICRMAETDLSADADPRFEYDMVDTNPDSASAYTYIDGILHKGLGARASFGLKAPISKFPVLHFKLLALFQAVSEASAPARDYTAYQDPLPTSAANSELTIGGTVVPATDFTLDQNAEVAYHENYQAAEIIHPDHAFSGSFVIEAGALTTIDPFDLAASKATSTWVWQQGVSAGDIVILNGPKMEIGKPSYNNDKKIAVWNVPFKVLPDAGNDDCKIAVK